MKIGYISTNMPRSCGLATFNSNLKSAIEKNLNINTDSSYVVAVNDSENLGQYAYPKEVKFIIRQQNQKDYLRAANFINNSLIDACIIQHEFGIYGGDSGMYVLPLLSRLKKPLIIILHTVLKEPTYIQKLIIQQIAKKSSRIVVMAQKAIEILSTIYDIPLEKIALIPHGVPDYEDSIESMLKGNQLYQSKRVLLTFGLLSRNKGLETVIKALPAVVKKHPDLNYTIIGSTHPTIKKNSGEEYRDALKLLAKELGVAKNVNFIDRFLPEEELMDYLRAAEIYITPYLNEAQITSGTLSYAVGAGAAVVSTPYWHAQEILANHRGVLFDFNNHDQLSAALMDLLDHPEKLKTIRDNAFEYGLNLRYSQIGGRYKALIKKIITEKQNAPIDEFTLDVALLPNFTLDYIKRLTDDTGIVQHARFGIPNLKEGYCMDDNARALILVLMSYNQLKNKEALDLLPIYLSFIQYMQCKDGDFRNFLSFKREYLDENGTDDSYGRTLWSLGFLIANSPNHSYKEFARELFFNSLQHLTYLTHLRGYANSIIGLAEYLDNTDQAVEVELKQLCDHLINAYTINKHDNWHWFEGKMTYDNAILPMALLKAYKVIGKEAYKTVGLESLDFLDQATHVDGCYEPVGNNGWYFKNGEKGVFDQQAIEIMAAVMMYYEAFEVTHENIYIKKMYNSFLWFLGENKLRIPLYDHETKGCCDGLTEIGLNRNQGAESTLAYYISYLTVLKAQEKVSIFNPITKDISKLNNV
nr:glycosyltransferase [Pseudopedobacter sp.]